VYWQVLGSVFLLIVITLLVIWRAKKNPYLVTGWLWYLGTLVPVIGIVQAGAQAMADRYTYIPLIGLFIMVAWAVPDILKKCKYQKEILLTLSALSIICLSIITWIQVGYWQNSITLFNHSLKITDNNFFIYTNRGVAYNGLGKYSQAIDDCSRAIEINPGYALAYTNRGIVYSNLGNYKQAIDDYSRAIEIKPGFALSYINRSIAYLSLGKNNLAVNDLKTAAILGDERAKNWLRSQGINW
jgi:tetratricopeptide (TPR) repeat protein